MKGLLMGMGIVLCGQMAFATPELKLVTGANTVTQIGAAGTVSYSNSNYGGWNISIVLGDSNSPNLTGSFGAFGIDITSLSATCTGGPCTSNPLDIYMSDTGFTQVAASFTNSFSSTQTGGTASQIAWDDTTNTIFGTGTSIGTVGPFSGTNAGSVKGGGPAGPGAYSLTVEDIFTSGGSSATFSTDGAITSTPEPGAMVLFGTVLAICGAKLRRRKQNS